MRATPEVYKAFLERNKQRPSLAPVLDTSEYPATWNAYVGQEPAKRMLQVAAKSARMRKEPLEHVLIAHPSPGIGKTALAVLTAKEMRRPCRVVSGAVTYNGIRMILSEMKDRDVLLYDEFHRVVEGGTRNAEWMLHYLQDGVLVGPMGPEPQPKVTIIAATTEAGRLPETITSRFHLQPPMGEYTDEEAVKIVQLMARAALGPDLPKLQRKQAEAVAAAAHKNPRAIRRLLTVLRDMTITGSLPLASGKYDIPALLAWQGLTYDGLDLVAQRYLVALANEFEGNAGINALEDRLQHPGGLGSVERVLMDKGLIAKTRTGRTLTQAGIARYRELLGEQ